MAQEATQAIGGAGAYESYVLCRWQEEAPPGLLSQEPALQPPLPSSCLFPCPTLGLVTCLPCGGMGKGEISSSFIPYP